MKLIAVTLIVAGPLFFLVCIVAAYFSGNGVIGGIIGAVGGFFGYLSFWWGKITFTRLRKANISSEKQSESDTRSPILYLRSFDSDKIAENQPGLNFKTEEEHLAQLVDSIGPFVAIGNPDQSLPELGAQRLYVKNEHWQNEVLSLMDKAKIVIFRLGSTDGLVWELEAAVKKIQPEQMVILIPKGNNPRRAALKTIKKIVPKQMPKDLNFDDSDAFVVSSLSGIVYFSQGFQPHFIELIAPPLSMRGLFEGPFPAALKFAFEPVFRQINADWQPPKKNYSFAIFIFGLTTFMLLCFLASQFVYGVF